MKKIRLLVVLTLTIIVVVPLFILAPIVGTLLYKNLFVLKATIKESELVGKNYILAQRDLVTGFDWLLMQDENGERIGRYFNIIGPDPFDEIYLRYDFEVSDNTFVFYITDKRIYYSEKMSMEMLEYVVTGWDILYPVTRNQYTETDLFGPKKYITEGDVNYGWEYLEKYLEKIGAILERLGLTGPRLYKAERYIQELFE